ncbi:DNA-3-methyladenine glycosylase family protein [Rubinisphaera margarita]|uniref:DNA-3-methyladenine glycosylase family protein n=1 Tax=Rubinisphaera margarita TaxID=2909586 RepID=UPI001EE8EAD0|nr:DNA-3-methyladenine glycosylase 2 family protein [Rubinisphaera margarita]MCG6156962.1 DNA-3-methyladenine glycosylase 2 family protein [Rubinisphaera margarita]
MSRLIGQVGPCTLKPNRRRFEMLLRAIVSQQISTAAARTIFKRVKGCSSTGRISLIGMQQVSDEQFLAAGLSRQKLKYIRDLIEHCGRREPDLSRLDRLTDEKIIAELIAIKGIGVWTAQMFLIFSLGRLDVLPTGDLGVQNAVRNLYGIDGEKDALIRKMQELSLQWTPYASIGSWYCWRSLDLKP